jgi:hypothetical protein
MMLKPGTAIPIERITEKIYLIRSMKVMLDRDLANLYEVETRALKQAVRRNIERFPADFMFELTAAELRDWRSQFVTSKEDKMGLRHAPMAFTEQGVAMLSSVLQSRRAIQVNIQIMRAFTGLRRMLSGYEELKAKIEEMEAKYDQSFQVVFEAMKKLLEVEDRPKRRIGFTGERTDASEVNRTRQLLRERKRLAFPKRKAASSKKYGR